MTQMTCIGGYLVVYKSYTIGSSKVVESAALSDEETKKLFTLTTGATKNG